MSASTSAGVKSTLNDGTIQCVESALPLPDGSLSMQVPASSIAAANKAVKAILPATSETGRQERGRTTTSLHSRREGSNWKKNHGFQSITHTHDAFVLETNSNDRS